jgi:predicted amidohydrolase
MEALDLIRERVRWCEREGVEILCCPEAILGGLADDAVDPAAIAISTSTGQLRTVLTPLASKSVTTIIGFTERDEAGRLFNTAAVIRHEAVVGLYRKRFPAIRRSVYAAGSASPLFTIGPLTFGIMICNDTNHPELASEIAARGATVALVPTNNALPPDRADVLARTRAVDVARAAENRLMIVRADVAGRLADRISFGSSAIVAADGRVLQSATPFSEDILVAEIAA